MLCEKCGQNKATTHIRSVINGVIHEKHLCGYCAANEGCNDMVGSNMSQMLFSILGDTSTAVPSSKLFKCKHCGTTFNDIADSGRCGCSECYQTFYEQLLPYIKRVHGNTQHIGKNLSKSITNNKDDAIAELRNKLSQLIVEEKYEQAAVLRDEIKKLEAQ